MLNHFSQQLIRNIIYDDVFHFRIYSAWRIMDTPTSMSADQLNRLRQALITNKDKNTCRCTSVARWHGNRWSVARDLQPEQGRQIYKCRRGRDWN